MLGLLPVSNEHPLLWHPPWRDGPPVPQPPPCGHGSFGWVAASLSRCEEMWARVDVKGGAWGRGGPR